MTKRMVVALIALVGAVIASYLALYKMGIIGSLACTNLGSCETVQTSKWATFLGVPVAMWGVGFYVALFVVALVGTTERFAESRGISTLMLVMTVWGVIFSSYLTWLELFVIDAICVYCVVSAILVIVLAVICWMDWREVRAMAA